MHTFVEWLSLLNWPTLSETYYGLDPTEYNRLFDQELERIVLRVSDPAHRQALERMRGINWTAYIAASVCRAGYRDQREIQERTHDIAAKLLTGTLFRGFDERTSGPMDLRFKASVGNAIRNMVEKERNRRRYVPTVHIGQEFRPGGITAGDLAAPSSPVHGDERVIQRFRDLVRHRLGDLAVAILDLRLAGGETKSLFGSPMVGGAGKSLIKRLVQQIKQLAYEFAVSLDDPVFLRRIERAMADEAATVQKRSAARMRTVPQLAGAAS
jgi:hypothetical protein